MHAASAAAHRKHDLIDESLLAERPGVATDKAETHFHRFHRRPSDPRDTGRTTGLLA